MLVKTNNYHCKIAVKKIQGLTSSMALKLIKTYNTIDSLYEHIDEIENASIRDMYAHLCLQLVAQCLIVIQTV